MLPVPSVLLPLRRLLLHAVLLTGVLLASLGFTRWVLARIGTQLPRVSGDEKRATRPVRRVHRRWGDLVFFSAHGRVYHVR